LSENIVVKDGVSVYPYISCLRYHSLSWPVSHINYYTTMATDHWTRGFGGRIRRRILRAAIGPLGPTQLPTELVLRAIFLEVRLASYLFTP